MLDTLTGGRVVAGMLRGTSNEYVTYGINPAESRERFEEAMELIVKAWTAPHAVGGRGRVSVERTRELDCNGWGPPRGVWGGGVVFPTPPPSPSAPAGCGTHPRRS